MEPLSTISSDIIEALLMLFLPLIAFAGLAAVRRKYSKFAGLILSVVLLCVTVISIHLLIIRWGEKELIYTFTWFTLGDNVVFDAGILLDTTTIIMLAVVSVIALLVSLFSISYMRDDIDQKRYFSNLGLFVFSMIGIVISNNMLVLFCFWELVGLSSYLLINHWWSNDDPPRAATKAFIVNRVGDAALLLGIAIAWAHFGTLGFGELYDTMAKSTLTGSDWVSSTGRMPSYMLTLMSICLFLGAAGKSAQFPFQVWLPDAMAGPTPVSALIHAATMVAAGVFLLARIFPLLTIDAMTWIAAIGAITAFMGAVAAMSQYDIKKVLAFSTVSQLGYMVMGMGVGAYDASLFHLFTHAFFKAGLFLAAGAVIHAMHVLLKEKNLADPQDMRNMGGLRRYMPVLFICYIFLALALVGIPFFSGYLSKEAILSGSFAWADARSGGSISAFHLIPYAGMVTVALTAYYMARQLYLVFLGKPRFVDQSTKKYPLPIQMILPIIILSVLSLGLLWSFNPFSFSRSWFFASLDVPQIVSPGFPAGFQMRIVDLAESNHLLVFLLSLAMILIGIVIAWVRYRKGRVAIGQKQSWFYQLSLQNWWLDRAYTAGIVVPVRALSSATLYTDRRIIDGLINSCVVAGVIFSKIIGWFDRTIVDGIVHLTVRAGRFAGDVFRSIQGGNVQRYVAAALLMMLLLFWLIY